MKARIQTPNFDALLADYAKKIDDINAAARECVEAGQEIQYQAMKQGLERHTKGVGKYGTGAAVDSLVKDPIVVEGDRVSTKTGTDKMKNAKGFEDSLYQEFGVGPLGATPGAHYAQGFASEHTLLVRTRKERFHKDPWFRPAMDNKKNGIRKKWIEIMKRRAGIDTK